jgi:hypothetical protein
MGQAADNLLPAESLGRAANQPDGPEAQPGRLKSLPHVTNLESVPAVVNSYRC